jgi:Flp pilus assembly pilin Flp
MKKIASQGQTIIEYTVVLGIVVTALIALQPMIKRASQGMIKLVADQIGNQEEADQRAFLANSTTQGHLEFAFTQMDAVVDTRTVEFLGLTNYIHADVTTIDTEQQSNLGFAPDPLP